MSAEPSNGKSRKRQAVKAAGGQNASKVKVTLYLPGDLEKRFAVHAIHSGLDRSELFAEMVRQHCRRFVVSDRLKPSEGEEGEAADDAA